MSNDRQTKNPGNGPDRSRKLHDDVTGSTEADRDADPETAATWSEDLDRETLQGGSVVSKMGAGEPCFTILAHPDPRRVGEVAFLSSSSGGEIRLSRTEPSFSSGDAAGAKPLADPHISRTPILLRQVGNLWSIEIEERLQVEIGGVPVIGKLELQGADLEGGVVLLLGGEIALLLHRRSQTFRGSDAPESMVGESGALVDVFDEIDRLARSRVPALIRGETGTGKELVAQAIHDRGPRRGGPFVAVNIASLTPSLAAAELFGSAKGAFTGSTGARQGLFRAAAGGTLFLDEIGMASPELQGLLLRALEDSSIRAVGSDRSETIDVRVLAATDARLETDIGEGTFSEALLQRLSRYEVRLPALRDRRADVGLLLDHFLRLEFADLDLAWPPAARNDQGRRGARWLSARLVAALAMHDWSGNVRQLRNIAARMALRFHDRDRVPTEEALSWLQTPEVEAGVESPGPLAAPPAPRRTPPSKEYRDPSEVCEDELVECLRANQWRMKPTAAALNVSRSSLYALVEKSSRVRQAKDLSAEQIAEALADNKGRLEPAAARLEVAKDALRARMRALGMD